MTSFKHADYTIAWICALPLEAAAARVMLDKTHNLLPQPSTDPNSYVLGELNGRFIVVACLPTGVYGTVSAATVVSYMRSTFTRIEFGLMVGIGGGVPGRSNDIQLGDVVVCKPVGKYNGVIQYDYGKAVQGGQFEPTGSLNKPPQALLTHMAQLEGKQMTKRETLLLKIVEKVLEENPDMKDRFSTPDQQTDLLFSSSYHHGDNKTDCANCDKGKLVHRQPRDTRAPCIHYGLIASGDQVMKDSETRDRLAEQYGILCFEMEAAGLMDELPTLVIRGICDYCDSHKHKEWQGYAALTAAAYARVLLSGLPVSLNTSSVVAPFGTTYFSFNDTKTKLSRETVSCDQNLVNPPYLQALQCPNPFVVKNRLKESKDKLLFKAIEWVFRNPQYCRWQYEDDVRLLWIRGGAGKGKTMMAIGLIEQLSQDDSSIVVYFFCQNADYELNSIEVIIKGLIYQLIRQRKELLELLQRRWDATHACFKEDISSWRMLWDIFLEMINHCKRQRVYVVVDALDECLNEGMAQFLRIIVRTGLDHSNVRWLLTSRPLDDADRELLTTAEQVEIGLELNSDHLEAAIKIYVKHKVRYLYSLDDYGQQMPQQLESELIQRAEGTFLWVSLVCKMLESDGSGERVPLGKALLAIQDLPPGLQPLYEQIFQQVLKGKAATAHACLRLLKVMMLVYRPLNRAEVFSVTGLSEEIDSEKIISRCASFIKTRGATIEFVHQSSRDFLAGSSLLGSHDQYGHGDVALSCLSYMSTVLKPNLVGLPLPNSGPPSKPPKERNFNREAAVLNRLDYAATLWAKHLEAASQTDLVQNAVSHRGTVWKFIEEKLLEWLECLSLLGGLSHALNILRVLEALAKASVYDATRLLLRHYQTISAWPLQIYSSVIVFSPAKSLVRTEHNLRKAPKWLKRIPHLESTWDSLTQTLTGHSQIVTAVAFSPDGRQIASASVDDTIRLWDATTGEHQKTLTDHRSQIFVTFSPDSKQIASQSLDGTIGLWDTSTGEHQETLASYPTWVDRLGRVAFFPDGKQLALVSRETIRLWDISTGKLQESLAGYFDIIQAVAFSSDSKQTDLASDSGIGLWKSSGEHQKILARYSDTVRAVEFSPDGKRLATVSNDDTIRLWDAITGEHQKMLTDYPSGIFMTFSPDSKQIALVSGATISLWNTSTGELQKTLAGHFNFIRAIAFSPDSKQLASVSDDQTIRLWDTSTGEHQKPLAGHSSSVRVVVFSPDGKQTASASNGSVSLWNTSTGEHQKTLFSPDEQITFARSNLFLNKDFWMRDENVKDCAQCGEPFSIFRRMHHCRICGQIFDYKCSSLMPGKKFGQPGTIRICKPCDVMFNEHKYYSKSVSAVAFSPDGKQIALASDDGTISLWDTDIGKHQKTLATHLASVIAVAFSSDNKQLASASVDGTIKLWDTSIGEYQKTLAGHSSDVRAVTFSPDSKQIASASADRTVKLWDTSTGWHQKTLAGHSGTVRAVAFSPDGKQLASASADRSIKLWDVDAALRSVRLLGASLSALFTFRNFLCEIEVSDTIKSMSYLTDGQYLQTNLGLFKISDYDFKGGLSVKDGWICYGMSPVFRILPGLQLSYYDVLGDYITIGSVDGQVLCLEFDCRVLEQLFSEAARDQI